MNSKDQYDINEEMIAELRVQEDAVKRISEKLGVREMGPADHIRTKHEIKAYVDSGKSDEGRLLIERASQRRTGEQQTVRRHQSQKQSEQL